MTRISVVRRAILNERLAGWRGLPWAAAIWAVAVAGRLALDPLVSGVPFVTFFPAVLVASVLLGWRWGAVVLAVAALTANYAFQFPFMAFTFGREELIALGSFVLAGALMVSAAEALRRAVVDIANAAEREAELNLELNHRVNNNLAVVQSLALQTLRVQPEPTAFTEAFTARLMALSEANKVLSGAAWEATPLPRLAQAALRPFDGSRQIRLEGPAATLPPESCVPLMLALHELATNATKYGALSSAKGCVHLTWRVEAGVCRMLWRETDGPPVTPPTRKGLGTRLLRPQSGIDELTLDFQPKGVVCDLAVRGAQLV